MRNISRLAPASLVFVAHGAAAMELDSLIPAGVPGLGAAAPLSVIGQAPAEDLPVPLQAGAVSLLPKVSAGFGYDSAPNGAAIGSAVFNTQSSLVVADVQAGFGAYISGNADYLPSETAEETTGYTVALGEEAVLPQETITMAGGYARTTQSGFGLNTLNLFKPLAFTVGDVTAQDKISAGMFTISPYISYTEASFDSLPDEDFSQIRGKAQVDFTPGGPVRLVTLVEMTRSTYRASIFDADSYAVLAGVDDDATGLWEFRLLGGAAWRRPRTGAGLVAPVLEAAANWLPSALDNVSVKLVHEIDDPDQVSVAGYTLTEADLSYTHELQRSLDFTGSFTAAHAAYFSGGLQESLFSADAALAWHWNRAFALNFAYAFNDRQADFLRAANEHVVTLNAVWTP